MVNYHFQKVAPFRIRKWCHSEWRSVGMAPVGVGRIHRGILLVYNSLLANGSITKVGAGAPGR